MASFSSWSDSQTVSAGIGTATEFLECKWILRPKFIILIDKQNITDVLLFFEEKIKKKKEI